MTVTDNHNRVINYLRLSVTDRCNLRCKYCVPHNLPQEPLRGALYCHTRIYSGWRGSQYLLGYGRFA